MKLPSVSLAPVRYLVKPNVPLVLVGSLSRLVVVPTDDAVRFAIEGPDPANDDRITQQFITRDSAYNVSSFLRPFDYEDSSTDLDALVSQAEHYRFVWTVARYEPWESPRDMTFHDSLTAARARASELEAIVSEERRRLRTHRTWFDEVDITVHRLES